MENTIDRFENRIDTTELYESLKAVRASVSKTVKGQRQMIDLLLTALLANGHVLIEGVPGVAKTLTAKVLAAHISGNYKRVQFTPDLMPSDVIGTSVFNAQKNIFEFRRGPVFGNIVLVDEINRAPAKTQSSLFEVMEERQITYDGTTYPMDEPFMVLATQNPVEQEGTYPLPEAQLDRFLFKINVDYPEAEDEFEILKANNGQQKIWKPEEIETLLDAAQIAHFRELTHQVIVKDEIMQYILQVIRGTRTCGELYLGASPRAGVALLAASKAWAILQGRDFVTPDDVASMAIHVLGHRIILTAEKEMEGEKPHRVLERIIKTVEVPR
ncbi:MoxR family ATPase [Limibacter armeniacum]|uniref:AAA family ATPase n=1 Tax=Limibacter armeniacum TaxID=466084 RepID=UPI002FE69CEF